MARGAITVKIDGKYDDKDLNRAIRDLNALKSQSGALASPMASLGKAALAAGAGFASFAVLGKVVDFMGDTMQAAMAEEKSVRALAQAFDNLGLSSQLPDAERGVARLSEMAAVADDDLRPALQTLVTATGDVGKSQALLETALNASAATGRSLESIVLGISKASTGQVAALRKLGIPLDDNIVKTKDFAGAIDVMNARFGGQAAEAANTYAGRMKSIGIAADEAKEVIGFALLNAVDDVAQAFGGDGGMKDAIAATGQILADFITGVGAATSAMANFIAGASEFTKIGGEGEKDWGDFFMGIAAGLPVINGLATGIDFVVQVGGQMGEQSKDRTAALTAETGRWNALTVALDPAKAALVGLTGASMDTAEAIEEETKRVSELTAAMGLLSQKAGQREALIAWREGLREFVTSPSAAAALQLVSDFEAAYSSFKEGGRAQAQFVVENYAEMKKSIDESGMGKAARAQLVEPLNEAYAAATNLLNQLHAIDGTQVSFGITGIQTINQYRPMDAPGRAVGGPVSAGMPYIVGERGPELFVPNSTGSIIPNGDLAGPTRGGGGHVSGGNSYSITVQAGVGDPRVIGQQVIEVIKRFEASNGKVFAAA